METGLAGPQISAREAAEDFQAVDSLDDLPLKLAVEGKSRGPCYKGRALEPLAPPAGWAPAVATNPERTWQAGKVAPLGANLAIVLYRNSTGRPRAGEHLVRLLYNEQVLPVPGCGGQLDCPLDTFLQVVVAGKAEPEQLARVCGSREVGNLLEEDIYELS